MRLDKRISWALATAIALGACGDTTEVDIDAAVAPFVGTWEADSMTVTSDADTTIVANILTFGSFAIAIQPSGGYTAQIVVNGMPGTEIGDLTVVGGTFVLNPSFPPTAPTSTSDYSHPSADRLILDGATTFDFNLDRVPEPAQAHIELVRQ